MPSKRIMPGRSTETKEVETPGFCTHHTPLLTSRLQISKSDKSDIRPFPVTSWNRLKTLVTQKKMSIKKNDRSISKGNSLITNDDRQLLFPLVKMLSWDVKKSVKKLYKFEILKLFQTIRYQIYFTYLYQIQSNQRCYRLRYIENMNVRRTNSLLYSVVYNNVKLLPFFICRCHHFFV